MGYANNNNNTFFSYAQVRKSTRMVFFLRKEKSAYQHEIGRQRQRRFYPFDYYYGLEV